MTDERLDETIEGYTHPAEPDLDTRREQADALLRDLRESFSPTYLTLISIIEGVLLGLMFELLSEGRPALRLLDPATLLVVNNALIIVLVWNEYRMGACMFRWVPSIVDAVIPFGIGGIQAALILTVSDAAIWLAWLTAFYAGGVVAFENMYRRSEAEGRNALVLERNRVYRVLNPVGSLVMAALVGGRAAFDLSRGSEPGWLPLLAVTGCNVAFLLRGELNWRAVVSTARLASTRP